MTWESLEKKYKKELAELYSKPVNRWVQLARERHYYDLETAHKRGMYFDGEAAERVVQFARLCRHSKGTWAGQSFEVEWWQRADILWPLFGWMNEDGNRRYRVAHIEVAKKNGKSTTGAMLGMYGLAGDGEMGAEIYSLATKQDQARIIHSEARNMARSSRELSPYLDVVKNNISMPVTNSKYEPKSSVADSEDGFMPHFGLCDETHRWKNADLWDVVEQSMAPRAQPMIFSFTTAGSSKECMCWKLRTHGTSILESFQNETYVDDTMFTYVATLDEEDDPFDEETWIKANPNLGVSVRVDEMRQKANKAQLSAAYYNGFLRYRCNVWTEQELRWLSVEAFDKCEADYDIEAMRDYPVTVGIDLSTKLDLCSAVFVWEPEPNLFRTWPVFFLPEECLEQRKQRDKVPYPEWAKQGHVLTCDGPEVDFAWVSRTVMEYGQIGKIQKVVFDPWNAAGEGQRLKNKGYKTEEMRQNYGNYNAPCRFLEAALISGRVEHPGNPVLRWNVKNVTARMDHKGYIMPDKGRSTEKIDGVTAWLMALKPLVGEAENAQSVYATRGMLKF